MVDRKNWEEIYKHSTHPIIPNENTNKEKKTTKKTKKNNNKNKTDDISDKKTHRQTSWRSAQ